MLMDPDVHRLPLTIWCLILSSWRLLRLLGVKALLCWVCRHRLWGGHDLIRANWILRVWHHGDFVHIEHFLFEVALLLWNLSKPPISNQATFQETSFDGSLSDSWGRPLRARCTCLIHVDLGAGVYPVELVLERAIASFDNGHLSQILLLSHDLFLQLALDNRHLHHLLLALLQILSLVFAFRTMRIWKTQHFITTKAWLCGGTMARACLWDVILPTLNKFWWFVISCSVWF